MSGSNRRVTSQDVANEAGVSRTTVSFVLNNVNQANISAQTRRRVLDAAERLGYVPHAAARALAGGKTRTLGLLVSHPDLIRVDAFVSQLLHSLLEVCLEHGYRLLIETATVTSSPEDFASMVRANQIDGLVVLGRYHEDPGLNALIASGYPLVLLGHYPHLETGAVYVDNEAGITKSTNHLIQLGHRRIAFIHFAPLGHFTSDPRLLGFARSLERAGIPYNPDMVFGGDFSAASGYEAMRRMLELPGLPTALVAGNDTIGIGAMAAIHEAGLRVPEDIAVVGFDDIPIARYTTPPLTTVRMPARAMGRAGGEMVIQMINGDTRLPIQRVFDTELIVRHSCGTNPASQPIIE